MAACHCGGVTARAFETDGRLTSSMPGRWIHIIQGTECVSHMLPSDIDALAEQLCRVLDVPRAHSHSHSSQHGRRNSPAGRSCLAGWSLPSHLVLRSQSVVVFCYSAPFHSIPPHHAPLTAAAPSGAFSEPFEAPPSRPRIVKAVFYQCSQVQCSHSAALDGPRVSSKERGKEWSRRDMHRECLSYMLWLSLSLHSDQMTNTIWPSLWQSVNTQICTMKYQVSTAVVGELHSVWQRYSVDRKICTYDNAAFARTTRELSLPSMHDYVEVSPTFGRIYYLDSHTELSKSLVYTCPVSLHEGTMVEHSPDCYKRAA